MHQALLDRLGRLAERGFYAFALMILAGAYTSLPMGGTAAPGVPGGAEYYYNPYNAFALWVVLFGVVILGLAHWRWLVPMARYHGWIGAWLGLAVLSLLWSHDPSTTLRRVITTSEAMLVADLMLARLSMIGAVRLLAGTLVVIALSSAAVALAFPSLGVMVDAAAWQAEGETLQGTWAGVFKHRNELGGAMVLGALCCGWLAWHDPRRRWRYATGLLVCVAVAAKTYSSTTMLMIGALPVFAAMYRSLRLGGLGRLWLLWGLGIGAVLAGLFFTLFYGDVMEALGRDPTMSGRVPLWTALVGLIAEHPVLGYGLSGFWHIENPDALRVWLIAKWQMFEAHEGYLEAMLNYGVPGLMLLLVIFGTVVWRSLRTPADWGSFAWLFVLVLITGDFAESKVFDGIHTMLLTLVYVALAISRGAVQAAPNRTRPAATPLATLGQPMAAGSVAQLVTHPRPR